MLRSRIGAVVSGCLIVGLSQVLHASHSGVEPDPLTHPWLTSSGLGLRSLQQGGGDDVPDNRRSKKPTASDSSASPLYRDQGTFASGGPPWYPPGGIDDLPAKKRRTPPGSSG